MISFILQEASEKANEIRTRADEEYNMEKAKIYKIEKKSLEEHYNIKRKQASLKSKMYLFIKPRRSFSHILNESRIDLLSLKENFLEMSVNDVKNKIACIYGKESQKTRILKSIAEQCINLLSEIGSLKVVCKKQDAQEIKNILSKYKKDIVLDLSLEEKYIGGIILKSGDEKIICDNSISKRIQQTIESRMPSIKKKLFNL